MKDVSIGQSLFTINPSSLGYGLGTCYQGEWWSLGVRSDLYPVDGSASRVVSVPRLTETPGDADGAATASIETVIIAPCPEKLTPTPSLASLGSKYRCQSKHVFQDMKAHFGYARVRYRDLAKNQSRFLCLAFLSTGCVVKHIFVVTGLLHL